jgi:hypothetical protein
MVKKEVVVCDICGNRVGRSKCNLCNKDICNYRACIREFHIDIGGMEFGIKGRRINILYCRNCWDKKIKDLINKDDFWDETFIENTAKSVANCIRKRLIIDGLEDKKIKNG